MIDSQMDEALARGRERLMHEIARERLEKELYLAWGFAGGPNECKHEYAAAIPCPDCDRDLVRTTCE